MKTEYLTAKEFADRAQVSMQTIYKQMSSGRLAPYVKDIQGQKMLPASLIDKFYGEQPEIKLGSIIIEEESTDNQSDTTVNQPDSLNQQPAQSTVEQLQSTVEQQLEILTKTIQTLTDQLVIKDQQIKDLNDRLAEASANLQAALQTTKGQQYIHAVEKQKDLEEVRDSTTKAQDTTTAADPEPIRTDPPKPQRKRSWWERIFR